MSKAGTSHRKQWRALCALDRGWPRPQHHCRNDASAHGPPLGIVTECPWRRHGPPCLPRSLSSLGKRSAGSQPRRIRAENIAGRSKSPAQASSSEPGMAVGPSASHRAWTGVSARWVVGTTASEHRRGPTRRGFDLILSAVGPLAGLKRGNARALSAPPLPHVFTATTQLPLPLLQLSF